MTFALPLRSLFKTTLLFFIVFVLASFCFAQQVIQGSTSDGALYEFFVPPSWNGELVVYAHGAVAPQAPIFLPNDTGFLALRNGLAANGFAVAYSSYSQNGFAVKDGAQRTHQLRGLFVSRVGQPARTYLMGASLGGIVVVDLAERFPTQYDGALAMCGLVGGSPLQIQYIGDARVLFDYFFPHVLPGDLLHTPPTDFSPGSPTFNAALNALQTGLFLSGTPTAQFLNTAHISAADPTEAISGSLQVIGFDLLFANDVLSRTHNHSPYDNTSIHYTGSANDALLNAGVGRFSSTPDAVNYIAKYYTPTGNLSIPMITLHTTRDPLAPFFHEAAFAKIVADAGASDFLIQKSVDRFGHCAFQPQEIFAAFSELVAWVHNGAAKQKSGDATIQ